MPFFNFDHYRSSSINKIDQTSGYVKVYSYSKYRWCELRWWMETVGMRLLIIRAWVTMIILSKIYKKHLLFVFPTSNYNRECLILTSYKCRSSGYFVERSDYFMSIVKGVPGKGTSNTKLWFQEILAQAKRSRSIIATLDASIYIWIRIYISSCDGVKTMSILH